MVVCVKIVCMRRDHTFYPRAGGVIYIANEEGLKMRCGCMLVSVQYGLLWIPAFKEVVSSLSPSAHTTCISLLKSFPQVCFVGKAILHILFDTMLC